MKAVAHQSNGFDRKRPCAHQVVNDIATQDSFDFRNATLPCVHGKSANKEASTSCEYHLFHLSDNGN